jgi:hypothetical protein
MSDRRLESGDQIVEQDGNTWGWVPGAIFVLAVVGGLAFWAYSSGDMERPTARTDTPTTTGQGTRPPAQR